MIVQGDAFNTSRIATVVVVPLTGNLPWSSAPGNVSLGRRDTGLSKDSVANVSQVVTRDREDLTERTGRVSDGKLTLILPGIDIMLGRP